MTSESSLPLYRAVSAPELSAPEPPTRELPECHDGVCITCSDEAVEVTVVAVLDDGLARVDTGQGVEEVSVMLVEASVGDRILVHAGEAIGVIHDGDA